MPRNSFHIAIYLHTLYNGGIERVLLNLIRELVKRGMTVDLVLDYFGYSPYLSQFPPEVKVIQHNAHGLLSRLKKLMGYLRQEQPVVLLSANHYPNEIAILAKRLSNVPTHVVVSEHTTLSSEIQKASPLNSRYWIPLVAKLLYGMADGIIAVSNGVAKDLAESAGIPADRIRTIYNPVISPEILVKAQEPVAHPWFTPESPPVILGVGRLAAQKDFANLITAFALVRQQQAARLMILGDGYLRSQLQALVQQLGLEEDVAMPGFVENPYAYIAKAAVFALSSAWEGLPTVMIESLALGTPIVATNCPSGASEILDQGKYGELVPVGDSQALAQGILRVLSGHIKPVDPAWMYQFTVECATQAYLDALGITVG